MKKLTISVGILASVLSTKAQDTLCLMVKAKKTIEFNYYTDKILNIENNDSKKNIHYYVEYGDVLCLHLYDKKNRVRKVVRTYKNGEVYSDILDSKSDVYFINGPVQVEVRKSRVKL